MKDIYREDIQIFTRHSNLTKIGAEKALEENIYNNAENWRKFLSFFCLSLGSVFMTAGIVFFFAGNWAELPTFVKLGVVEFLIIATVVATLFVKIHRTIRNIILNAAAFLVGVLFAVFGQVYQTGADAYDFFLAWTIFISLWVIISNYAPMWLMYIALINITFVLYWQQVASNWSELTVNFTLFIFNTLILAGAMFLPRIRNRMATPNWFINTMTLVSVTLATVLEMQMVIFNTDYQTSYLVFQLTTIAVYLIGVWYAITSKNMVFLAFISLSILVLSSGLVIRHLGFDDFSIPLLFIVIASASVIAMLINVQKKWSNAK